jgi:N-acetylneuraminic acid mutarotase
MAGEIYATGGRDEDDDALSSVEKYTPSNDTWSAVAPLPTARSHHAAVTVGSVVYVLGGHDGAVIVAIVLTYDSTEDTWSQVSPMPARRHAFAACAVGSKIYVFGGWCSSRAQKTV